MKSTSFDRQIVLYLIKYTQCNSSYLLVKVLSRKFYIINYLDVFTDLLKKDLVKKHTKDQIDYYDITEAGDELVKKEIDLLREYLSDNISNYDEEYIKALLSSSSVDEGDV